jgi:branched-chain amino acid transport system substrate-binding protein
MKSLSPFLLAAAFFLLPGHAGAAEPIRLGVAGAHSGDLAPYGLPSLRAAELLVKEVNATGGVLGRPVELVVEDDQCKPEMASTVASRLVTRKVDAVLGHICSGATKAALGIYREAKIVAISPSATTPSLTRSGEYPNFFRTIAPDDLQAKVAAQFAIDTLGLKKFAILHDKADYGKGFADNARKFIEGSGKAQVVLFEGITPGAFDYSAVVQKVRREGADAVIYGGYHPEASKLIIQLRRKQVNAVFLSDDGVKDESFLKVAGKSAEGAYATGPRDLAARPAYIKAVEAFRQAYRAEPGAFYPEAYSAVQALFGAMQKAGSTDYAAVQKALRSEFAETPVGRIRFDAKGDAEGVGFSIYQVKNGKYMEVK